MSIGRLFALILVIAGGTAASYTISRHTRRVEKRQHKQDVHAWEDEGGNLAPSETAAAGWPAPAS